MTLNETRMGHLIHTYMYNQMIRLLCAQLIYQHTERMEGDQKQMNTQSCTFHDNASGTKEVEKIKVVRSRVHTVSLIPSYIKGLLSSC